MRKLPAPPMPAWLARQLPFERYLLDVGDGLHMHVMEAGAGRPVFMLHGNPTWGFLYRKIAQRLLPHGFRVVMPDLIGLGFSDKPRDLGVHQIENHSRWVGSAIDQLDLRDLIFVGQDWGGALGLHPLSTRRERVTAMVILNTVVGPPKEGFNATAFHKLAHTPIVSDVLLRGLGLTERTMFMVQGDRSSIRGDVARAYRYPLRRFRDRAAPLALARMAPVSMTHPSIPALQQCAEFAQEFQGAVQIVWGRRDPVLARALKRTKAFLGDPPVVETQAGHFLQEEVPDEIADAIRAVALETRDETPVARV